MAELLRLFITPDAGPGRFVARLESSDEPIVQGTRQPLVDGARVLLERGLDPTTPVTMRHAGQAFDSFRPLPITAWALWTYKEPDQRPLYRRWMRFADIWSDQETRSEPLVAPKAHRPGNRLYGDPGCIGDAHGGRA
ncbi:hypothetical protein SAMN02990966_06123 [Rhodospirillales bacterium URHD0017]|nr:hypothetical protein SAMN02990966_06123 [Rhodospirillales bacterium URHD0017]